MYFKNFIVFFMVFTFLNCSWFSILFFFISSSFLGYLIDIFCMLLRFLILEILPKTLIA
jgi:hypothetical protein